MEATALRTAHQNTVNHTGLYSVPLQLEDTFSKTPLVKKLILANGCDPLAFVRAHQNAIRVCIKQYGGLLIRGCALKQVSDLQVLTEILYGSCLDYIGGVSPRSSRQQQVYNSTYIANNMVIPQHREMSYLPESPDRVSFYCCHPADFGGETPVTDFMQVYQDLLARDASYMKRLEQVGVFMDRVYYDSGYLKKHFGLKQPWGWQESFQCSTHDELDDIAEKLQVRFKHYHNYSVMLSNLPVSTMHPIHKKPVFYPNLYLNKRTTANHFQMTREARLQQKMLASLIHKENNDIYTGDKWLIPDAFIRHFHQAVKENTYTFRWRANDLLLLDNNWLGHGRYEYGGTRRNICVCLNNSD